MADAVRIFDWSRTPLGPAEALAELDICASARVNAHLNLARLRKNPTGAPSGGV